jgi:CheY-like chemotaxis protein
MSKIDADKMTPYNVTFELREAVHRAELIVGQLIQEKEQRLTIRIDEAIPVSLIGDDQRFAQVVTNILSNAVKFTPQGGDIAVDVTLAEMAESTCRIRVDVTDTGIGIAEDQQRNLFQAFEQADKDTSRRFGGTGLGLALSKRIVEMMGGRIWLRSILGQGSTFSFDCQFEVAAPEQPPQGLEGASEESVPDLTGHVILLAEDVEINREIVRTLLLPTGVTILEAENGEKAVAMFEENPIDLILMDIQMPYTDGYEATQRIRKHDRENAKTIPIIAMTANVFKDDIEHCLAAGMNEHLGKPIDFSALLRVLKNYLV